MRPLVWARSGYQRYVSGEHVIESTSNPTALRRWYVVGGPHDSGVGLDSGLCGGFFKLADAKAAVERAIRMLTAPGPECEP